MARIPIPQQNVGPDANLTNRRASAADFSTGGEGMQAFGQGLQQLSQGLTTADIAMKHKQEQEDKFNLQVQSAQEAADWSKKFEAEKTAAPLGAAGFTDNLTKSFDEETQKRLDDGTMSEGLRRDYTLKRMSLKQSLVQNATAFESRSKGELYKTNAEGTITNLSQVAASDPNAYDKTIAGWGETVDAMPLDAMTKQSIKEHGEKAIRIAAARGEAERNPAAVKGALQGALGISAGGPSKGIGEGRLNMVYEGSLDSAAPGRPAPKDVYSRFIAEGATPKEALLLTGAAASESSFNASATHDGGIGLGMFGHNKERLAAMRRFAGTDQPSWQQQAAFALKELRSRPEGARVNAAQTAEDLADIQMAFEAPRGYTSSTPQAGHNYTGRLNTIRRFTALSGSEVIAATSPESAAAAAAQGGGKTGNAILDALPTSERMQILGLAESAINRQQVDMRASLEPRVKDAEAAYLSTGEYAGPPVTRSDFHRAYDPEVAEQKWTEFESVREVGEQVSVMKTLPQGQIEAAVASAKPVGTGEGFAVEQRKYEAVQKAASAIKQQREADPAAYVMQTFPGARAAWAAAGSAATPDDRATATRGAIAAMDAAYEKLGVPVAKRDLLPKQSVETTLAAYNDETQPLEQRVDAIKSLLASTPDPETKKRVFDQMVRSDNKLGKTEAAFDAWLRGDAGASTRLFRAAAEGGPEKLAGKMPVKDSEIKQAIADTVMAQGKIGDATYGLAAGVVGNEEKARRDISLMEDAVRYEVLKNGGDVEKAVAQATKDIYGKVKVVSDSQVTAIIPDGTDESVFRTGAAALRGQFKTALETFIPKEPAGLDAKQKEGFRIHQADARRYVETVFANGQIRNFGKGYGMVNPETGQFIADATGKPVVATLDQILAMKPAAPEAPRFSPMGDVQ